MSYSPAAHSGRDRCRLALAVLFLLAAIVLPAVLLPGCARTPEDAAFDQVRRRFTVTFDVAGRINPAYYYFIALDTFADPSFGPVPVVSSPWGNGWGTGRITHFVQYHLGVFTVFAFRENTNLLQADPLGSPFEFNRPEDAPGNQIRVVLDLDRLQPNLQRINMNIITTDRIDIQPTFQATKMYDGLGATGNDFATLPVDTTQIFTNAMSFTPEGAGDLPPQPSPTVTAADLDITDWSVDVRVLR